MISRTRITCLSCSKPITARIQIGHELHQAINFPCPHCGTEVKLTLVLDQPPRVEIRWDENCEAGKEEGAVINIGAGFTISSDKLHQDFYFPAFEAPGLNFARLGQDFSSSTIIDTALASGTLRYAAEKWKILQKAYRFHRTGQLDNLAKQLEIFWGQVPKEGEGIGDAIFAFLMRLMEPNSLRWLSPLAEEMKKARVKNPTEFFELINHLDSDLKTDRFESYIDIISEYFKSYGEFNQTLACARQGIELPVDAVATSADFDKTRMFYGNAFELLGSNLDIPAALNNIIAGRSYDQMQSMDLKQYRTINKANRLKCFAADSEFLGLALEFDSTIRNASHHRWFKLSDSRREISFKSGGTGALQKMSYAEYLHRCNRLAIQIMLLCCLELLMLQYTGKEL